MIDTRTKILAVEDAMLRVAALRVDGLRTVAAAAFFDPMLPQHVSQLARVVGDAKLVLVIATPEDAYLPVRARAEIAASLGCVDTVVIAEGDAAALTRSLGVDQVLAVQDVESVRRGGFIDYVRERAR